MSASYWLTLETMLEIDEKENLYSGALCSVALGPSCCRLTWCGLGLGSGLGLGLGLGLALTLTLTLTLSRTELQP